MLTIKGVQHADYFAIQCADCGANTQNEYMGWDPGMPYFRATCPKCKETGQWKLSISEWKGLPTKPSN